MGLTVTAPQAHEIANRSEMVMGALRMTFSTDILGRPPIMKPRQEPEEQHDPDWKGEKFISSRAYSRMGNKFTLSNVLRKARKKVRS